MLSKTRRKFFSYIQRSSILILATFSFLISLQANGQEQVESRNEIKINGGYYIISGYLNLKYPELSYERILNKTSGIGLSFKDEQDRGIRYIFIPYYRYYFGKKMATGFFIEGNGSFFSLKTRDLESKNELGLGIGIAVGGKFLIEDKWLAELVIGGGRNFMNINNISNVYPRFGIVVGRRF